MVHRRFAEQRRLLCVAPAVAAAAVAVGAPTARGVQPVLRAAACAHEAHFAGRRGCAAPRRRLVAVVDSVAVAAAGVAAVAAVNGGRESTQIAAPPKPLTGQGEEVYGAECQRNDAHSGHSAQNGDQEPQKPGHFGDAQLRHHEEEHFDIELRHV